MCIRDRADLVVFPEIWSSGYEVPFGRPLLEHGAYMRSFQEEARRLGLGIVATCLSKGKKLPQDTAVVISPTGEILMRYAKVHTCDFSAERTLEPGEGFAVCDFPFEGGRVRLGVMTGFDREYPESARELMLKGAELIVVPNAGAMDPLRLGQLRTRAFENMVGVAMANYPGLGWGCSCACLLYTSYQPGRSRPMTEKGMPLLREKAAPCRSICPASRE